MSGSYNVKIRTFPNGEQTICIYQNSIKTSFFTNDDLMPCMTRKDYIKVDDFEVLDYHIYSELDEQEKEKDNSNSLKSSINRTRNKIYDYARSNTWEYFFTFTFNGTKNDRYDYEECSNKLSQWLKDTRKRKSSDMKYVIVPEQHKDGAWHFHGLFSNLEGLEFEKAYFPEGHKKEGQLIKANGKQVYNCLNYNLGFTTLTKIGDTKKASNYITKYITKELVEVAPNKKRYWNSRNLELPQVEKILYNEVQLKILKEYIKKENYHIKRVVLKKENFENIIDYYTINIDKK